MKVFVVTCGAYPSDTEVVGVYSSLDLAKKKQEKVNKGLRAERSWDSQEAQYASIEEYELDEVD